MKSQDVPCRCTERRMDGQRDNRHICILHLYLKSKYGVKVVRANITEVMFFIKVEGMGFIPDCISRFVK